jgi:hypothetical protein
MSPESKTAIFGELRARLYGGLELYEHPALIGELRRLRAKFSAGRAAVLNPRIGRSHGDMVQALAVAVSELRRQPGRAGRSSATAGRRSTASVQMTTEAGMSLSSKALLRLSRGAESTRPTRRCTL